MSCQYCNSPEKTTFEVGDIIHGFAGGSFGRDSYDCKKVEYIGRDYIVLRVIDYGEESNHTVLLSSTSPQYAYRTFSEYHLKMDDHCTCL